MKLNPVASFGTPHFRALGRDSVVLALADATALLLGLAVGDLFVFGAVSMRFSLLVIPAWIAAATVIRLYPGWGMGAAEELRRVEGLLAVLFGSAAAALFLSQMTSSASRGSFLVAFALCTVLIPISRAAFRGARLRAGRWGAPSVIYGRASSVPMLVKILREDASLGFRPVGVFTDSDVAAEVPRLGGLGDRATDGAEVSLLDTSGFSRHEIVELIEGPLADCRQIIMIPDLLEAPSLWVRPCDLQGILGLEITRTLTNPMSAWTKRVAEIAFVVLLSPVWVPVLAVALFLTWAWDRHAPLYRQTRIGFGGRPFVALKIRTMTPEADRRLQQMLAEKPELRAEWDRDFKLRNDPRITPIGRFLRRWSIDELPQFLNVVRGEMSIVGPRPLPEYHHAQIPARVRALRERVRPGLTGLWQVSGRSDSGADGIERWDAYYVRNWSIWLDLVILARTFCILARPRGAY